MEVLMHEMQRALQLFEEWCTGVGSLLANPDKTQCILFTRKRSLDTSSDTSKGSIFYGETLDFTKEVKYLGVMLDDKLNWRAHMEQVTFRRVNMKMAKF